MATPHVAGCVALLMAAQPEAPVSDIIQVLKETALHRSRTKDCPHRAPVASPGLRWTAQTLRAGSGRISRSFIVREAEA
ncbi:MAG: hypothetical protein JO344_08820 [Planctomycetaceae bacterium]|nr:hypothetical protein [Planctomycetaceae bacterium]